MILWDLILPGKKSRCHQAIAKFRCFSHTFKIERGRRINPNTFGADKKCSYCYAIKDEKDFVLMYYINMPDREYFFQNIREYMMGLCMWIILLFD